MHGRWFPARAGMTKGRMRTRLSVCNRKARYASAEAAITAARQAGLALWPYACDKCRKFHLTSRRKGKWLPRLADD